MSYIQLNTKKTREAHLISKDEAKMEFRDDTIQNFKKKNVHFLPSVVIGEIGKVTSFWWIFICFVALPSRVTVEDDWKALVQHHLSEERHRQAVFLFEISLILCEYSKNGKRPISEMRRSQYKEGGSARRLNIAFGVVIDKRALHSDGLEAELVDPKVEIVHLHFLG